MKSKIGVCTDPDGCTSYTYKLYKLQSSLSENPEKFTPIDAFVPILLVICACAALIARLAASRSAVVLAASNFCCAALYPAIADKNVGSCHGALGLSNAAIFPKPESSRNARLPN